MRKQKKGGGGGGQELAGKETQSEEKHRTTAVSQLRQSDIIIFTANKLNFMRIFLPLSQLIFKAFYGITRKKYWRRKRRIRWNK